MNYAGITLRHNAKVRKIPLMLQCNRELLSTVSLFFLLVLWEFDPVKCCVPNFNETYS